MHIKSSPHQLAASSAAQHRGLPCRPSALSDRCQCLQVLQHRASGPASTFAAYISQLPVGIPGIPMFFRPEAVAALQYPPVSEQVKRRGRWLHGFSTKVRAQAHSRAWQ